MCFIGLVLFTVLFIMDNRSTILSGVFQNVTTVLKLIPLLLIGICGLLFFSGNTAVIPTASTAASSENALSLILAGVPGVAFAYDGWAQAIMMAPEVKDSKKNFPIALTIAPIIILVVYVAYFTGVCNILGAEKAMEMGDTHVFYAAKQLLGKVGAKLVNLFVLISVVGTVNVSVMANMRTPYSLAVCPNNIFMENKLKELDKNGMAVNSSILAFCIVVFWLIAHYVTTKFNLLPNSDISEIACVTSYVLFAIIYFKVLRM